MRIVVPHHTTRAAARKRVEEKFSQLLGEYGQHADDADHHWTGDTLMFRGKAKGFTIEGSVEVTDTEVILDGKLPLLARAFEPKIRQTVEREAARIFRA